MAAQALHRSLFSFSTTRHYLSPFSYPPCRSSFVAMFASTSVPPPDVAKLAESARIVLTSEEVEQFTPKIRQVVDWFGQLQAVDLESVEPALRADMDVYDNLRPDAPEIFKNRESMLSSVPSYDEPYIKVPKVLNKE
ncbi:glutamyl-tRNA(Gln) amidotransferase subunit C, chloroplastic/mitochondrial [Nymphaea colorata]|nr:glutamyl-tRNA(Gln) amidotransferase subunit C, chloroplastic/mitochondrial [Nymphaea colorata]XP_031505562.1 glutamyl-tRNA(Gln) amidotransferase subunit C, chloroplastic/mitochondrial [Nymphaea colorata]XP_031505563.1 glutamyl-tRNA(Gln) amidotransferase subunit C, chloroplastic/mitochondrial [Nymphaea colorata]XP_031505565.1 glutamyl-tRNA(Gln) amidotransferase subunit C, chloroplastic/mitochondrial [Nymphaea colorata]XP_031505566.1 glutamyl-tRNA(Gln) amidotransferase subunit C, chloroplastic